MAGMPARLWRACGRARGLLSLGCGPLAWPPAPAPSTPLGAPPPQPAEQPGTRDRAAAQIRVALILPLSAPGNAGVAAQSMKNAAEMALAEFKQPNIQLLVKDDGGTPQGAQAAAQQAIAEGAEIIVGPLFAQSVSAVGQVARQRGIPVIAFSTDASVAARGVYLLSFLPESDVRAHRRLRHLARQAFVRGAAAGQCLWRGGRSRVPAGGRAPRRPRAWRWRSIRSIPRA